MIEQTTYSTIGGRKPINSEQYIKSPLNYIGGKYKILSQIVPLFPKEIDHFVDLFAGGCNVGVNVRANKITCNDNLLYLIELFKQLQDNSIEVVVSHIEERIGRFSLSITNETGYKQLRELYNTNRNYLDLFVLTAYSFNHQIRFNNSHEFNNPFGKERSSFNDTMRCNLIKFAQQLKRLNINFTCSDFELFDMSDLNSKDFVYCDPPYLITTGTYNDGKRGFKGWSEKEEQSLLLRLDDLSKQNIKFALSNVLEHKGKSNDMLKNWVRDNRYVITPISTNYSNSSYNTINRDKTSSIEVLITNYTPGKQKTLFDEIYW